MINLYKDKCPHCGTYISIQGATLCPGCRSEVYYSDYLYFPSQEYRDDNIGIISHTKAYNREKYYGMVAEREKKGKVGALGGAVIFSIPLVWIFFGGSNWENFGAYGWSALGLGIFLLISSGAFKDYA